MRIIKLDAIDSTNDFLKGLTQNQRIENYTIVTAKTQTKGKGQHGSKWHDEYNKNLITSILIKETLTTIEGIFVLNIAVTLGILSALQKNNIPSLSVKWPNDIMSENKKIAGILIENLIQENGKIQSIIGIGLNVNQTEFDDLPKASSLKSITDIEYDIEELVIQIVAEIKKKVALISDNNSEILWKEYQQNLFKKGIPVVLENQKGVKFMGIIQEVNRNGKLEVLLEDDSIQAYGIKEVSLIY